MIPNIFSRNFWAGLISERIEKTKKGDVELFLRIFNEYFHKFRRRFALIVVLIFVAAAASAAPVWMVRDVVDGIFVQKQSQLVLPLFFLILLIFIVKGGSTYWQTVLSSQISNAMVADVQNRMFRHILRQRVSFFNDKSSDELTMRFNQGAQGFNSILTTVLVTGSRDAATLIFLLATMVYLDPTLTFLSFVVAPLVFYGINVLLGKLKEITQMEMAGLAALNKHVRETVQGITVIKSFNLEKPLGEQSRVVVDELEERRNKIASLQAAPVPLLDTLGGVAVGLAILYAGSRTVEGTYDSKNFVAFVLALILAAEHARRLSQLPVKLKTAFVAIEMVFSLLNDDQSEKSGSEKLALSNVQDSAAPLISFRDVNFSYDKKTPILTGFNLDIKRGEMVALVGPSGAGKSTIFKLLLKLYGTDQGNIQVAGMDINVLDLFLLRDNISYVGQSNFIFSGTIKENLTLSDDSIDQSVIEGACKKVGLHEFIMNKPGGYGADVGELGAMISGGQAQRLNMARAIIKDAPVLLLDEVTSALDAENEQLIKDYVESQVGQKTIIVIAHRLSTVKGATRIALVDGGKVIDVAPHDELLNTNEYYEKIVSLQFRH